MTEARNSKPLALTQGEPAGVGPELILYLWQNRKELQLPPFFVIGHPAAFGFSHTPIGLITDPEQAAPVFNKALPLLTVADMPAPTLGALDKATIATTISAIDRAVELALSGQIDAIITAPIHKEHLASGGFDAPGHTEYLARRAGLEDSASVMMLASHQTSPPLRCVPVTVHCALKDVPSKLTTDKIVHAGVVTACDLRTYFGIETPHIALAGLNPHAGEGGRMGLEEATHIQPAIWQLQDLGIQVSGPHAPDTLFHSEARAAYDAVLCMYHDQALIPLKTLDFWGGVNVTLGLPFIRTSPDHGTALEIAGKGLARPDSMIAAVRMAADMACRRGPSGRTLIPNEVRHD